MPLVEAQDAISPVPICQNDERAVGKAEPEVFITALKLDDRGVVRTLQACYGEAPGRKITQERSSCGMPEALAEEIVDLRCYRGGDHQRPGFARENFEDLVAAGLVGVGERHNGRSVEE